EPNQTMRSNRDWSATDFEQLAPDAIPVTAYKPRGDRARYNRDYTHWEVDGIRTSARDHYRIAWRTMAANTGERTLIAAVIPSGCAHVNNLFSLGVLGGSSSSCAVLGGFFSSLLIDFMVRVRSEERRVGKECMCGW